ncbi:Ltp family lipoprotein [Paenibacillus sp. EKM211P]|uniref:Ltp family lipoprotein n=1 Tax=Paenibacillus sp. EKM211P TaxID=1683679 RepID=UPI0013E8FA94|nr:Ltp family lipoprotein [Paenibacillus sp. EKM211P]KAF6585023.1 Ltp family lipoprotein [Paenibacillus sp. EKM211P]
MKKPFYKKWWFWVIIVVLVIGALGSKNNDPAKTATTDSKTTDTKAVSTTANVEKKEEPKVKTEAKEESVPREHKAALKKAMEYAETMNMSKAGIYDQLTSEYGEHFDKKAARYAIENIVFDWKGNALKKAQSYAETMNMSNPAIYDQLISEHGEKFTKEEAKYAIANLK